MRRWQTVVETRAFLAQARGRLTDAEREAAVLAVARNPIIGDLIPDGGGIRKMRLAIGGRGKRGGARVIYFHHSSGLPIFLLAVFAKNERSDLTPAERRSLAGACKEIAKTFGAR
jgi:hypothetical protein